MGARRNFRRGEQAPKRPPQDEKGPPPQKKKIVLAPFSEGSEACSPEKMLTVVLPTTFYMHLSRSVFRISFWWEGSI